MTDSIQESYRTLVVAHTELERRLADAKVLMADLAIEYALVCGSSHYPSDRYRAACAYLNLADFSECTCDECAEFASSFGKLHKQLAAAQAEVEGLKLEAGDYQEIIEDVRADRRRLRIAIARMRPVVDSAVWYAKDDRMCFKHALLNAVDAARKGAGDGEN